jgi:hypothetical protein
MQCQPTSHSSNSATILSLSRAKYYFNRFKPVPQELHPGVYEKYMASLHCELSEVIRIHERLWGSIDSLTVICTMDLAFSYIFSSIAVGNSFEVLKYWGYARKGSYQF